jgi:hypothetical protein
MTKPKKNYATLYRAQRKKFYKHRIKDFKEELNDTEYSTALAQLKLEHMDDLDIITEVEREIE